MKVRVCVIVWAVCLWLFGASCFVSVYGQTTYVFTVNSHSVLPVTIKINGQDYILNSANRYAKPNSEDAVTVVLYGNNNSWIAFDKDNDAITEMERIVVYRDGIKPEDRGVATIDYIRIILKGQTKITRSDSHPEVPDPDQGVPVYGDETNSSEIPDEVIMDSPFDNRAEQSNNNSWKESVINGVGDLGTIYGNAVVQGMNIPMDGFPYFSVHAGYNRFNDFSFGLKYRSKGFTGASLFANCGFVKKSYGLPWDVGFGICFQDFAIDMRFGNTDLSPNYGLMVDATYDWYFVDNLGVSFMVGLGCGDIEKKEPDIIWNLGIALTCKLWSR